MVLILTVLLCAPAANARAASRSSAASHDISFASEMAISPARNCFAFFILSVARSSMGSFTTSDDPNFPSSRILFLASTLKTSTAVTSWNGFPKTRSVNSARPSSLWPLIAEIMERQYIFS